MNNIKPIVEAVAITISERFGYILPSNVINKDILYVPDDLALRFRAEKTERKPTTDANGNIIVDDKYTLEFANIWIDSMEFSWKRQRSSVARQGIGTEFKSVTPDGREIWKMHKAVPVDITFRVSFWTKYKEKMDEFVQEFMFWQQDNPNINLFYDDDKKLDFDVLIGVLPETDDTKISKMFQEGKYWKHSFRFVVEAWIFREVAVRTAKEIILDMYLSPDLKTRGEQVFSRTIAKAYLNIAFMVGDPAAIDENEAAAIDYLRYLGHKVTTKDTITLPEANAFDLLVFSYWWMSQDIAFLKPTIAGILLMYQNITLGFGDLNPITYDSKTIDIVNRSHYITQNYGLGSLKVHDPPQVNGLSGFTKFHNNEKELAKYVIGVCEKGETLRDGTSAAARRAICGIWQFKYAIDDGKELVRRAVAWAGGIDLEE